jgi:hypothetical protein
MPLFLLIVFLPGAWFAFNLGVLLQRLLPGLWVVLSPATQGWVMAHLGTMLWLGPCLVLLGLFLLFIEVVRHWVGMLLDSIFILVGGSIWLSACMLSASLFFSWLALPVFTLLVAPAFTAVIVLQLLSVDDSIDGSLGTVVVFTLIAAVLHLLVHGGLGL